MSWYWFPPLQFLNIEKYKSIAPSEVQIQTLHTFSIFMLLILQCILQAAMCKLDVFYLNSLSSFYSHPKQMHTQVRSRCLDTRWLIPVLSTAAARINTNWELLVTASCFRWVLLFNSFSSLTSLIWSQVFSLQTFSPRLEFAKFKSTVSVAPLRVP